MARHRNTDPKKALQSAQRLFWKHGYGGLGTRQLEEETGITRFTLQTSYGGKKPLFLQTLTAYLDAMESIFLPDASSGDLEALAAWFEFRASSKFLPGVGCNGCLMLNSIVEFRGQDAEVNQKAERFFSMLHDRFKDLLETARKYDSLDPDVDIDAMVEILFGISLSMNVIIRAASDNVAAKPLALATAAMIRGWKIT